MVNTQAGNLFKFVLMFYKVTDSYFMNCDMSYIKEKYDKLIGFEPEFNIELTDVSDLSLREEWIEKWKKDIDSLTNFELSVLNFLCLMNVRKLTPDRVYDIFRNLIGDIDRIEKHPYTIHPKLDQFIMRYIDDNLREINIELLV